MSKIEWTDKTWNPVIGCRRVSPGCQNCYAERMAARLACNPMTPQYEGLAEFTPGGPRWSGAAVAQPDKLSEPFGWKKGKRIFVNSMSDLFHEDLSFEFIAAVFGVMSKASQHTFQVLTKRPRRMLEFFEWIRRQYEPTFGHPTGFCREKAADYGAPTRVKFGDWLPKWPLENVWLGVSAENRDMWAERVTLLHNVPAVVRFVSAEPLLGSLGDIGPELRHCVDWVIAGGESGPGARPINPDWVQSIHAQCGESGTPFFFKQWGAWQPQYEDEDDPNCDCFPENDEHTQACKDATHFWRWVGGGPAGYEARTALVSRRVGKAEAGRTLGGETYSQFPEVNRD